MGWKQRRVATKLLNKDVSKFENLYARSSVLAVPYKEGKLKMRWEMFSERLIQNRQGKHNKEHRWLRPKDCEADTLSATGARPFAKSGPTTSREGKCAAALVPASRLT